VKLLADVNVSGSWLERPRALGHDVSRVTDHIDARTRDPLVLELAVRIGAVLVTRDQDFAAILAHRGAAQPSIINVRRSSIDPEQLALELDAVIRRSSEDLAAGAIATLDEAGARVHRLPIR
jgi:predicted nuclease of predicted toxin-antitoxin system